MLTVLFTAEERWDLQAISLYCLAEVQRPEELGPAIPALNYIVHQAQQATQAAPAKKKIPEERWDHRPYHCIGSPKSSGQKSYQRFGRPSPPSQKRSRDLPSK